MTLAVATWISTPQSSAFAQGRKAPEFPSVDSVSSPQALFELLSRLPFEAAAQYIEDNFPQLLAKNLLFTDKVGTIIITGGPMIIILAEIAGGSLIPVSR